VWVIANSDDTVWKIDPNSNKAERFFVGPKKGCVDTGCDLTVGEGAVWVRDTFAIRKLDPHSGKELGTASGVVASKVIGLEAGSGAVWTMSDKGAVRIDHVSIKVAATIAFPPSDENFGCAVGRGSVWCMSSGDEVVEIDPANNKVIQTYKTGASGSGENGITFAEGALWILDGDDGGIVRMQVPDGSVTREQDLTFGVFWSLAVGSGEVWVTDYAGQILKVETSALTEHGPS
jgi:streptogramin lyase